MKFAEYLEYFGWSQAEFARRVGVSPDTVTRWRGEAPQIYMMWLEERRKRILFLQSLRELQDGEAADIFSQDARRNEDCDISDNPFYKLAKAYKEVV